MSDQPAMNRPKLTRRSYLFIAATLALLTVAALALSWILYNRDGLHHALHLQKVPNSVSIRRTAGESWTDYLFEADLSLRPDDADKLLAGREFVRAENDFQIGKVTELWGTSLYNGFLVTEAWLWEDPPDDVPEGQYASTCTVYFNEVRDRAFVRYTSD